MESGPKSVSSKFENIPGDINPVKHPDTYEEAEKAYGPLGVYCHDLVVSYGSTTAVDGLNMIVPHRSLYVLLGASGCGKTTLLLTMCGVRTPKKGTVRVLGHRPWTRGLHIPGYNVGYMPQDLALLENLTIAETTEFYALVVGMTREEVMRRTNYLIAYLQLPPSYTQIAQLSAGQKKRVSLLVALLQRPKLLVLDEPTAGMDPDLRSSILMYLYNLTVQHSCTVIMTSHYIEEARVADRFSMMRRGKLLVEGTSSEVCKYFGVNKLALIFVDLCKAQGGDDEESRPKSYYDILFEWRGKMWHYLCCRCGYIYDKRSPWLDDLELETTSASASELDQPSRPGGGIDCEDAGKQSLWVQDLLKMKTKIKSLHRGGQSGETPGTREDMVARDPDIPLFNSALWCRWRWCMCNPSILWAICRQTFMDLLHTPSAVFIFMILPICQAVLFVLVLGSYPRGLNIGIVDRDTNPITLSLDQIFGPLWPMDESQEIHVHAPTIVQELSDNEMVTFVQETNLTEALEKARRRDLFGVWEFPANFTRMFVLRYALPFLISETLENSTKVKMTLDEAEKMSIRSVLNMMSKVLDDVGTGTVKMNIDRILRRLSKPYQLLLWVMDTFVIPMTNNCTGYPVTNKRSARPVKEMSENCTQFFGFIDKIVSQPGFPCLEGYHMDIPDMMKIFDLFNGCLQGGQETKKSTSNNNECQKNILDSFEEGHLKFKPIVDPLCPNEQSGAIYGLLDFPFIRGLKIRNAIDTLLERLKKVKINFLGKQIKLEIPQWFCEKILPKYDFTPDHFLDQMEALLIYLAKAAAPFFKPKEDTTSSGRQASFTSTFNFTKAKNLAVSLCQWYVARRPSWNDTLPSFDPALISSPWRPTFVYGGIEGANFKQFLAPALILLLIFYVSASVAAVSLIKIRYYKILERYYATGVTDMDIVVGITVTNILLVLIQQTMLMLIVYGLFQVETAGGFTDMLIFFAILTLHGAMGTMFGLLVSSCTPNIIGSVGTVAAILTYIIFISGALWPTHGYWPFFKYLSLVIPSSAAIEFSRDVLNRGMIYSSPAFWSGNLIPLGYLILFMIGTFVVLWWNK